MYPIVSSHAHTLTACACKAKVILRLFCLRVEKYEIFCLLFEMISHPIIYMTEQLILKLHRNLVPENFKSNVNKTKNNVKPIHIFFFYVLSFYSYLLQTFSDQS